MYFLGKIMKIDILKGGLDDYELIDTGNRKRLERFGDLKIIRHEPRAWWRNSAGKSEWTGADAEFDSEGRWSFRSGKIPPAFQMKFKNLKFEARISHSSRHLGVFPEQSPHWEWICSKKAIPHKGKKPTLLNMFAYTGISTLCALSAGYEVVHVDASKPALDWARRNQELSGMGSAPARWLLDDAMKFLAREIRRNRFYDAIVLDPPSFGRGPSKELWKAEESLHELLSMCRQLLSDNPSFILLTMYNIEASSLMLGNILSDTCSGLGGTINCGELILGQTSSEKVLPLSIFSKWER